MTSDPGGPPFGSRRTTSLEDLCGGRRRRSTDLGDRRGDQEKKERDRLLETDQGSMKIQTRDFDNREDISGFHIKVKIFRSLIEKRKEDVMIPSRGRFRSRRRYRPMSFVQSRYSLNLFRGNQFDPLTTSL